MLCVIYLYFVFEGNSRVLAPGGLYLEGLIIGVLTYFDFWGLIFGGASFLNFKVH